MNSRDIQLATWLGSLKELPTFTLTPLAGDASFRRYFRIGHPEGSYVAMDAPPPTENCAPFVAIANALRAQGLHTPEIIASDIEQGFLLLTDFGDRLYLKELNAQNADTLYGNAMDALIRIQSCRQVDHWTVPNFTAAFMEQELHLFKEWYLLKHLQLELSASDEAMLTDCFRFLAETAAAQPQVFMHRDYHSANLMVLPDNQVGILDFQDAFVGPLTYDLVSLLRDCYIAWPDEQVRRLALQFHSQLTQVQVSETDFLRWFDLMGLQRHLKAILTFSRKLHRDQNANYLKHIPRTLSYVMTISERYPECKNFHAFMKAKTPCEA